ncbi:MAG: histidinol-phosphatase HisJ family protein [Clostridiales bacterium]|nr:histidinol-phosphatase HisJ family protein [Clostridiales bacterium]
MGSRLPLAARSSPHVHTQFCDGRSTAEEMVQAALEKGFVSLGFSSHAKQDFDLKYAMDDAREAAYIAEIRRLQRLYGGRIRIWLGMEQDLYSTARREGFEYVIASVHYMKMPDGSRLAVDSSPAQTERIIREAFDGDPYLLVERYYSLLGAFVRDSRPDIIGHFDLLTKYNQGTHPFDESHPLYVTAAMAALEEAITGCRLMEVNVGALARTGVKGPYPSLAILTAWRDLGGEVILSSDCHEARYLDSAYEAGLALMAAAGYKKAAILGRHEALFETVSLIS